VGGRLLFERAFRGLELFPPVVFSGRQPVTLLRVPPALLDGLVALLTEAVALAGDGLDVPDRGGVLAAEGFEFAPELGQGILVGGRLLFERAFRGLELFPPVVFSGRQPVTLLGVPPALFEGEVAFLIQGHDFAPQGLNLIRELFELLAKVPAGVLRLPQGGCVLFLELALFPLVAVLDLAQPLLRLVGLASALLLPIQLPCFEFGLPLRACGLVLGRHRRAGRLVFRSGFGEPLVALLEVLAELLDLALKLGELSACGLVLGRVLKMVGLNPGQAVKLRLALGQVGPQSFQLDREPFAQLAGGVALRLHLVEERGLPLKFGVFVSDLPGLVSEPVTLDPGLLGLVFQLGNIAPQRLVRRALDVEFGLDRFQFPPEGEDLGPLAVHGFGWGDDERPLTLGPTDNERSLAVFTLDRLPDVFVANVQGALAVGAGGRKMGSHLEVDSAESAAGLNACEV
jgi:hypothetical protein